MTKKLRVLVVDDSLTVREMLREILEADGRFTVVAAARTGAEALTACDTHRPDVITLDMALPGMSGLEVTRTVMQRAPCPILIVSSSLNRDESLSTLDALAAGAIDVFDKDDATTRDARGRSRLCEAVALTARIPVVRHITPPGTGSRRRTPPALHVGVGRGPAVIAIGASTGGPGALRRVLQRWAPRPDVAALAVVHISRRFGSRLAEWLDGQVDVPVRDAVDGEPLLADDGAVRLPAQDRHLVVDGDVLRLSDAPPRHGVRPAVERLFESLIGRGSRVHAVLLTGMGQDGASAMMDLREDGARTYAQDEASSVVWGMPGAAVALGAVERVDSPEHLGTRLGAVGISADADEK